MTENEEATFVAPTGRPTNEMAFSSRRRSLGLIDRPCSDTDLLQHFLQVESSRDSLQRYAAELYSLLDESAKARERAQFQAQSKSAFLAMMSREMRGPLNGIIGMTAVLLERDLTAPDRDCVETIRKSAEALLAIINEILEFSKTEAGELDQFQNQTATIAP